VRPAKYFDQDMVIYRAETGKPVVMQAHCRHQGAHLGYGGKVSGEDIVCPFHAWKWNSAGDNIEIPYSKQGCVSAKMRTWPVIERSGLVLMWYHPAGEAPTFEPPTVAAFEDPEFYPIYPHGTAMDKVPFPPQVLAENGVDWPHLKYVHHWDAGEFGLEKFEDRGNSFYIKIFGAINTAKGVAKLTSEMNRWGVGLTYTRLTGLRDYGFVCGMTPIDESESEIRLSSAVRRKSGDTADVPDNVAVALHAGQVKELLSDKAGGDRMIWTHMEYKANPILVREEVAGTHALRVWLDKQYQDARLTHSPNPATA
jgi:phenylpropionate dioxygenase-like ring-hydroxylating dioxygenase large terminal subunit